MADAVAAPAGSLRDRSVRRIASDGGVTAATRTVPVEAPVAVEFNGIGYAVMMATPADLADFATGFALSERIVAVVGEIEEVEPVETPRGWLLRIRIAPGRVAAMADRVRTRVSESSCGLCGLENLDQVLRPLPRLAPGPAIEPQAIFAALGSLRAHQALNAATGAAHAAAFCRPDGAIVAVREDVGRHNALDKLLGALAAAGIAPADGFLLLTSRCSYELVEKAVTAGCSMLVTISAATSLAAERAAAAGLRLVFLARSDTMLEDDGA